MEKNQETKNYAERLISLLAKKMDINISKYDMDELVKGMFIELEHGSGNEKTNVTDNDPIKTFQIVLAHMNEIPDYYTRLEKMEKEAMSVKTTDYEKENEEDLEEEKKEVKIESVSKRFKELCGIVENENKKQLKNINYQEKSNINLLKEEIDTNKFKIIKFNNDGIGKKETEEDIELYKMQKGE